MEMREGTENKTSDGAFLINFQSISQTKSTVTLLYSKQVHRVILNMPVLMFNKKNTL